MSKPADILREKRHQAMQYAEACEKHASELETEAAELRRTAQDRRNLYCQLGGAIQVLDGDNAPLDLPGENKPQKADA